ncbi:hypothetical protein MTO96_007404 [Rhipicephalus appendiculatus]
MDLQKCHFSDFCGSAISYQKCHFSGSVINYRNPTTSSDGRMCNDFANIARWNAVFSNVGLQLRELSPGELSFVGTHHANVQPSMLEQQQKKEAALLLCDLLSRPHCIVSVHLNEKIFTDHHQLICDTLRKRPSLKKFTLCRVYMKTNGAQNFAAALPHLNELQELELNHVTFNRASIEAISEFLATTRSLTTLTMTDQRFDRQHAVILIKGLRQNATISALSLRMNLLNMVSSRSGDIFADYLRYNQTLRSLTVTSSSQSCFFDLRPIIGALFYNNILSELNLIGFSLDAPNNQIIAEMLLRNKGLRSFHLVNFDRCKNIYLPVISSESSLNSLWMSALAENNTLEELTMDLLCIKPEDYSCFFQALARNTSLKKISVPAFRQNDVAQICHALRDAGVEERFFIGEHRVLKDTAVSLPECKPLSRIRLYLGARDEVEPLHTTLSLLPTCSHVKSLCLEMTGPTFNRKVSSLIAEYVTHTTGLRELRLELFSGIRYSTDHSEWTLLKALSNNKSIRKLSLKGMYINLCEARLLADMLLSNRTLCHLSFYPYNVDATKWLLLMLPPYISRNYVLLDMCTSLHERLGDCWSRIKVVLCRNNSLVTRAAHFVMGMRNRFCAAAVELLQSNLGLQEKVQELASIDEDEALSRVENSLNSFTELDDFMCVAGVVKDTVTCHRRDDGQKQLVDLNRDCWLYIRQYLKMADILDPKKQRHARASIALSEHTSVRPQTLALVLVENMLFLKSRFSGSVVNYRTSCTSTAGRLCNVFEDLPPWNKFFWQGHHQLICHALRKSPSLRKLKLCRLNMTTDASQSFTAALPHLNQLQELELSDVTFNRASLEGLSEFLARTRSLTTLTVTDQCIKGEDAVIVHSRTQAERDNLDAVAPRESSEHGLVTVWGNFRRILEV